MIKPKLTSMLCFILLTWSGLGVSAKEELGAIPPEGDPKQTLTLIHAIKLPQPMRGLSISPDGKLIAAGHLQGEQALTVNLWNLESGDKVKTLEKSASFASASFSPDGKYFFSGAWTVKDVKPPHGEISAVWRESDGVVLREWPMVAQAYSFTPDGAILAVSQWKTLELYRFPDMKPEGSMKGPHGNIKFTEDGTLFAATMSPTATGKVGIWRFSDRKQLIKVKSKPGFGGGVRNLAFSKEKQFLATGHDKGIDIWRVEDGKKVTSIKHKMKGWKKRSFPTMGLAFSDDGKKIIALWVELFGRGDKGAGIWMWRIADRKLLSSFVTEGTSSEIPWWPIYSPELGGVMAQKIDNDILSFWKLEEMTKTFSSP